MKYSYGVFAALGVNILKHGGTLCYIMSDTWQTIRTHYKLRKKLFEETEAQYIISVPMRTFTATVNTGIYLFKKSTVDSEKDNWVIAADFRGLDIKNGDLENAFEELIKNDPDETYADGYTILSDREKAIYAYRQKIIKKFSNLSFFIASPNLFALMDDTTTVTLGNPPVMKVDFNGKEIELVKLGDIADVKRGMDTGDNKICLRKSASVSGNLEQLDKKILLTSDHVEKIIKEESLRREIIVKGFSLNKNSPHYFEGRYFVPYDKGGSADVDTAWLPNYYVPTQYFIDWSKQKVTKYHSGTPVTSRSGKPYMRNKFYLFKEGITFSRTGYYSPTFRENCRCVYDTAGSCIYPTKIEQSILLPILTSKIFKYFL